MSAVPSREVEMNPHHTALKIEPSPASREREGPAASAAGG
jgi:hypothetical protein